MLRLLLRGEHLDGARWSVSGTGMRLGTPKVSSNGHWCFVDLSIQPGAAPGKRFITATNRQGSARIAFELTPGPAPRTRPLGKDDVLYLLLPDRFQDGDPANNRPAGAELVYDPTRPRHFHGG
ncbi:MAG: cyclomaltodextrinase N-terminal domain-containing protein, partial [Armatimonadaceae bacterium]